MLISSSVYPQFILCLKQAALAPVPLLLFPTVLQRTFRCNRVHLFRPSRRHFQRFFFELVFFFLFDKNEHISGHGTLNQRASLYPLSWTGPGSNGVTFVQVSVAQVQFD